MTSPTTLKGRKAVLNSFDIAASRRAIYVDYEGNKNAPPTLLGWRQGGTYSANIVEPVFETCAKRYRAKQPVFVEHARAAAELVELAVTQRSHIVSWSVHDLKLLHAVLGPPDQERLLQVYVNALDVARPWHWKTFETTAMGGAKLAYFAELLKIRIPEKYGDKVVGSNLTMLRSRLSEGAKYHELGTGDRGRWVTVVKHNQCDLDAMERIVQSILRKGRGS